MKVAGWIFDGQSSARRAASLEKAGAEFVLWVEGELEPRVFSLAAVRIRERVGEAPRVFEFPNSARFETSENDVVDKHFVGYSGLGFVHWLESRWPVVFVSLIVLIVGTFLGYKYALPVVARHLAHSMNPSVVEFISNMSLKYMEEQFEPSRLSAEEAKRLDELFARLQKEFPGYSLKLRKFRGSIPLRNINAFALPDGTIIVLDGLAELIGRDEMMSIFMHEMGHVVYRHGLQGLIQGLVVSGFFLYFSGGADWSSVMGVLTMAKFSRDHEREADYYAAQQLKRLGLRPSLLADALESIYFKMKADGMRDVTLPALLMSHPLTEERKRYLRAFDPPPTPEEVPKLKEATRIIEPPVVPDDSEESEEAH